MVSEVSEHAVVVGCRLRDDLEHIPVLDYLAVGVDSEDVDTGVVMVTRPHLVAVQHDVLTLCDGSYELDPLSGELSSHSLEVVDEGLLAIGDMGVVLGVGISRVALDGFGWTQVIEHQVIEGHHVCLVLFKIGSHATKHARICGPRPR